MVGFLNDFSIEVKEEEEETEPIQPVDFSLQEFDDFSFADSLIDFDCFKDWMEGNPEQTDPGMLGTENIEFLGMDKQDFRKEANAEAGFRRLGNFGSWVVEELGKVSLEGGDEFVGVDGNCVKSGEIVSIKCEVEKNCEIDGGNGIKKSAEFVDIDGHSAESCQIVSMKCEGEKNCEIVGGGGIKKSDEFVGIDENGVKSGEIVPIGCEGGKNSEIVGAKSNVVEGIDKNLANGEESNGESEPKSDSESESESESSSSSSSPSSSSSSEDDDLDHEEEEGEMDVEEGEFAWSDEDDEGLGSVNAGPIMSRNEVKVLPHVTPVDVILQPCHQTVPVGVVSSIIGAQVIVEGLENHNPLNEGSILWITEKRSPLGRVDEIFGPVKNPYYMVRYNTDGEVPAGIQQGTLIAFVPEFADHVLNDSNLYKKGYDASGKDDEELSNEAEFSDDEKEAEYKRMLKTSKRGTKDQTVFETKRKIKKKFKNEGGRWESNRPSGVGPTASSLDQGNSSHSVPAQGVSGVPGSLPTFPQLLPVTGFAGPFSGVWINGMTRQQPQNMGFPNSVPPHNMPWIQQNNPPRPYQMPPLQSFQQQFNITQMMPSNFVLPGGQLGSGAGPTFGPWNPLTMGQHSFNQSQTPMGLEGQHAPTSMNIGGQQGGVLSGGFQMEQNRDFQPPSAIPGSPGASQNFNQRGRGKKPFRRGGGRFGGGRGRQQPN